MSDEESFVILGSSPMSSLENDGMDTRKLINSSLESDTPGSRFASLKNSQIDDLKSAQQIATQSQTSVTKKSLSPTNATIENNQDLAASKLWSRTPQALDESIRQLSLEDCALKSSLEQQREQKIQGTPKTNGEEQSNSKTTPLSSVDNNLAASFIMGEIDSDVLKTSVYSQFPSISLEASAEDVVKLQNMVTEYSQLKSTIKKANGTMKLFYQSSLQWKEKMQTMEEDYKQQLTDCKNEIVELRKQNDEMDKNLQTQIEAIQIARKKDREEYIQEISEKNALLENMRAQIIKLEQQQLASFEMVLTNDEKHRADNVYMSHLEYDRKIKDLERQLSALLASNLDFKDVEKQYIQELDCLKVNFTAAEELIAKHRSQIIELQSLNIEKDQQIQTLNMSFKSLQLAFEEQKERIALLETQNEVYRTDFDIEKQSRETAVKEKQQMLQDLRSLQKKNQELIEEQQKLADNYQRRISLANTDGQIKAASAAAQSYFNNPQRPIRGLPPSSSADTSASVASHMCPICNKHFKYLNILLSHVDDCIRNSG